MRAEGLQQISLPGLEDLASSEVEHRSKFSVGITGEVHGAGSTTAAKALAQILGFSYEYAGQTIRTMAVQRGYATDEQDDKGLVRFNKKIVQQDPEIDALLDCYIISEALAGNCVFEGKAAVILAKAHKLPSKNTASTTGWSLANAKGVACETPIFSIVLTCDENIAARRILLRKHLHANNIDPNNFTAEDKILFMAGLDEESVRGQADISRERLQTTRQSWERLYLLSQLEKQEGQYDISVDTTDFTPQQVVGTILCRLVENRHFFSLLSDVTRTKIEAMFPGIQKLYPVE